MARTYPLRLPGSLRDRVDRIAKKNERSLNWQITDLVRKGLAAEKTEPVKEEGGAE